MSSGNGIRGCLKDVIFPAGTGVNYPLCELWDLCGSKICSNFLCLGLIKENACKKKYDLLPSLREDPNPLECVFKILFTGDYLMKITSLIEARLFRLSVFLAIPFSFFSSSYRSYYSY